MLNERNPESDAGQPMVYEIRIKGHLSHHLHTGDNYADQSAVGSVFWLSGRTRKLHATIDYMLKNWQGHDRINPERIGTFGFSAGGFTVLTAAALLALLVTTGLAVYKPRGMTSYGWRKQQKQRVVSQP